MRFSLAAMTLAGVASAQSMGMPAPNNGTGVSYVTEVVTAYTTFCSNTVITHGSATYTVSSATTLTITNCPCTITKPVTTAVVTSCSTAVPTGTAPGKPVVPVAPGTVSYTKGAPTPTASPITPAKGAAEKISVGVAGVLAMAGLVAAL